METIKALTDEQLTAKLAEYGEQIGPITPTTRGLFERRLLKHVLPSGGAPLAEIEDINGSVQAAPSNDSTENKSTCDASEVKPVVKKEPSVYYGVQLPANSIIEEDVVFVFIEKTEALKLMKKFPGSRFKPFSTRHHAERFSRGLPDLSVPPSPKPPNIHMLPGPAPGRPFPVEGSTYRSVKTQDLVKLRKLLETGDVLGAKCLIWSNPRFLINSGDTPTILQEGFRYNALHVAAMKNQPKSAELIIETLENPNFMQLLYPGEPELTKENRIQFLVDLYLNTPDKGLGESALHFACKFGHAEVVNVLAAHPMTDRYRKNKYDDTPESLICTRSKVPCTAQLKQKIRDMLDDRYYVQLWRSEDNSCPAHVAEPWSPTVDADTTLSSPGGHGSPSRNGGIVQPMAGRNGSALPSTPGRHTGTMTTSSVVTSSPRDSPISIKAYAGPMSSTQAKNFRKQWLTPPSASPQERKQLADVRRKDCDKGLERIGRTVAHTMDIPWSEYWEFLGAYADFSTEEGLEKLERYLKERHDSLRREKDLENELNLVSAKLNQLRLTSPTTSANNIFGGKSLSCGGGDTLVLYMDKVPVESETNKIGGGDSKHTNDNSQNDKTLTKTPDSNLPTAKPNEKLSPTEVLDMSSEFWRDHDIPLIDDSDSEGSIDSFHTALDVEESDTESLFTPPQGPTPYNEPQVMQYYIYGTEPNKIDLDVLRALEGINLTEQDHPHIHRWKHRVQAYREDEKSRWGTPRYIRAATQSRINAATPSRQLLPAGVSPYSPLPSPGGFYRSPSFSPSSASSASESDTSFDSIGSTRINLMSSFLSEK